MFVLPCETETYKPYHQEVRNHEQVLQLESSDTKKADLHPHEKKKTNANAEQSIQKGKKDAISRARECPVDRALQIFHLLLEKATATAD